MEKIMVQTPVSAPSDNTPTPPLAHPAKAKSTTAKSSKSTEKAAKLRKLTDAQIADYARALVTAAEAGAFPGKMIPVATWAEEMQISAYWMERIFRCSRLQKDDYDLDLDKGTDDKRPYRDERGMIMIANSAINAHNDGAPADQQFAIGQRFDVTFEPDRIILTRPR
ncbi:hypothetical protein [Solidesulfovibrio alcoholivorans]|uniref:hypothetical protein n=1 Tax=Solidesulfovibrio alcoholivorans TaxID=81406 RepID=UPI00138DF80A|nr:hypothetical protein [Solidesulfovibrio alcoholivorans]